ncbi:hypothetical protein Noca_3733 [Nocardioides sp. JS614]|nr:hypothetical protein Noca_3733 [Nocardioides sp. JS614]
MPASQGRGSVGGTDLVPRRFLAGSSPVPSSRLPAVSKRRRRRWACPPRRWIPRPEKEPVMKSMLAERREVWRSLTHQDKQQRLEDLRRRHQSQVELEMLRLRHQTR